MQNRIPISQMQLGHRQIGVWAVSSMEQIIGAGLSTIVGIIIPMMQLASAGHRMPGLLQGTIGAAGLLGIAVGSPVIGRISDADGYLRWFRICPALIFVASLLAVIFPHKAVLIPALFLIGFGVGGGYTLDSAYISETMPSKWKLMMVGAAKATCSLGFMGFAAIAWWWLGSGLGADHWNYLFYITAAAGLITFLRRLRWAESPVWLADHGHREAALKAAETLLGPDAGIDSARPAAVSSKGGTPAKQSFFKGRNLLKVIFSGVTWACEGVGVYGVGVFLPLLIIALGFDRSHAEGMDKIINSVEMTTMINFFIIPGFIIGLLLVRRLNHGKMMTWGFLISALGMAVLLWAYIDRWPVWISIVAFMTFEIALNAGPHLVTFIIPSQIYPVEIRGAGDGIAAMFGKVGAILGVFLMPVLLESGGIRLVLVVCVAVMILGALVSAVLTPVVLPPAKKQKKS